MKFLFGLTLVLSGTLLAGCASHPKKSAAAVPPRAIVTPDNSRVATVAWWNPVGRFVVLLFPETQMPPDGQVLYLYHGGLKTGEVKIVGPQTGDDVVADLTSGDAQVGDEVRNQ
jgi:hypothetical protein